MFLIITALACKNHEGDDPGECSDEADNDRDGLFDCSDPDCFGSPSCEEADTGTDEDEETREPLANSYSLHFDGMDDYAQLADVSGLDGNGLTLEAWIFYERTNDINQTIVARRDFTSSIEAAFTFRVLAGSGDGLEFGFCDGATNDGGYGIAGATAVPTGKWSHAAATYDRSTGEMKLYMNGAQDGSGVAPYEAATGSFPMWIGADPAHGASGRSFGGYIDEIRIWNHVRSESEIATDMGTAPTGAESGLVVYWSMEDGTDQLLTDQTGNGWDAILGMDAEPDASDPTWEATTPFL